MHNFYHLYPRIEEEVDRGLEPSPTDNSKSSVRIFL
jgi:hypothetical protein